MSNREKIANKIKELLNKAKKNVNEEYIAPDAFHMEKTMNQLLDSDIDEKDIHFPNSEFSSGAYAKESESLHDEILDDLTKLSKKSCYNCGNQIDKGYNFCPFCLFSQN